MEGEEENKILNEHLVHNENGDENTESIELSMFAHETDKECSNSCDTLEDIIEEENLEIKTINQETIESSMEPKDCKIEILNQISDTSLVNENFSESFEGIPEGEVCKCSICKEDEVDGLREDIGVAYEKVKCIFKAPDDKLTDEQKVEKDFRKIFQQLYSKYECQVRDKDQSRPLGYQIRKMGESVAYTLEIYVKRSSSPTDVRVDSKEIEIDCLVMWANELEKGGANYNAVEDVCDQGSLVRILQDKKTKSNKDYISEEGFTQLILDFHENSTENMAPHERVLKTLAYADMVKVWPPRLLILLFAIWTIFFHSYEVIAKELGYRYTIPDFCSRLILNPLRSGEFWRYLTYSWLHSSWTHLFSNLLGLVIFGIPLEFTNRWWRIFLVYCIGVLAGSLVHYLFSPALFLLGASAGVYALITAHLSTIILNWSEDEAILLRRVKRFSKGRYIKSREVRVIRLLIVAFFFIFDIVRSNLESSSSSNTSYVSHVGGASVGLLAAIIFFKNRKVDYWEIFFQKFVVVVILVLYIVAILFNFFGHTWYPNYFPEQQTLGNSQWENCCNFYFIDKCKYENESNFGQFDYCFDRERIPAEMRCCRIADNVTRTCSARLY